ncbi:HD domain-containing protein [Olleya aquimaris]|uniref:HD domain-containing protein n=1 Tax=Olleya aquimaris TaxID=639310 RepID=A0A327R9M7_9FLAO|nr:HD domain-containing protein [Olleya aquimaris]RAJ13421.1 HD domain-containing protein [Olleya aquimaris]
MFKEFKNLHTHVVTLLDTNLPSYLSYHDTKHTLYVLDKAIYIANKEGITKNDLCLLKIAALFHDIGYIKAYDNHEEESIKIAKKELQNFSISNDDIEVICNMIRATKIPQHPKTKLDMILADADLEYLSTNNFKVFGDLLFEELKHLNPKLTRQEWNATQISFLKNHQYHTTYCKRYKEHRKQKNLDYLIASHL